jgi:VWFA-related protein
MPSSFLMPMIRSVTAGLLALGLAWSQEASQVIRATVNVVVAPTLVTDQHGEFVGGLEASDFRLEDNDKLQNINVDISYVPISMVVAVQMNSAAEPVLPQIRKIGSLLQGAVVGDEGEVAIIGFDHRIQVLQDFTTSYDKIEAGLKQLRPGGESSRMIDAVLQSARMLGKRPANRRRVLLLISETRDYGSESQLSDALTELQFQNVSVYSVNMSKLVTTVLAKKAPPRPDPLPPAAHPLPPGVPATPSSVSQTTGNPSNSGDFIPALAGIFRSIKGAFNDNPSEVFTKWTGGDERTFRNQRDLESAVQGIGDELHSQYLISYSPNNPEEGGYHRIRVSLPNYPGAKIRTRPGYWVAARPN